MAHSSEATASYEPEAQASESAPPTRPLFHAIHSLALRVGVARVRHPIVCAGGSSESVSVLSGKPRLPQILFGQAGLSTEEGKSRLANDRNQTHGLEAGGFFRLRVEAGNEAERPANLLGTGTLAARPGGCARHRDSCRFVAVGKNF
jgi:hypothetical protein